MDQSEGGKTETNVSQRSGHDMPMTVVKIILLLLSFSVVGLKITM